MKLAVVTGTVTATSKDAQLVGFKLLLTDITDGRGQVTDPAVVAVDTVGAGVGDTVLLALGSSARLPSATAGAPVDATIVAVVDHVSLTAPTLSGSQRGESARPRSTNRSAKRS